MHKNIHIACKGHYIFKNQNCLNRDGTQFRVQELCESRGSHPGLVNLTVSVDVQQHLKKHDLVSFSIRGGRASSLRTCLDALLLSQSR